MNKLYPFLTLLLLSALVWAQSPQKMSYQAVVRDNNNNLVVKRPVGVKMSVLKGSEKGNVVYSELFSPNPETNANGLLTLEIGGGTPVSGTFSEIDWSKGPFFVRTEIDPSGGSNYTVTGTSPLLSVPFALHALTVEKDKVDDADNDPTNEIQQLNLSGTTLSLSKGGGSVNLPTSGEGGSDNWGTQSVVSDATLDGVGTSASPLKLADNAVTSAKIADGAVSGSKIGSEAVTDTKIAAGAVTSAKIAIGAVTGTKIAQAGASSGQVLKWDGSQWIPSDDESGGGGFSLPFEGQVTIDGTALSITNLSSGDNAAGLSVTAKNTAVYGVSRSESGNISAIYGTTQNPEGNGVLGYAVNSAAGNSSGVRGISRSLSGRGVSGLASSESGINYGVHGESYSSEGRGVLGYAYNTSGSNYGVYGISRSSAGRGVYGSATSTTGTNYGVYGESQSSSGTGVYGSGKAAGIKGESQIYGVQGVATGITGRGVYGRVTNTSGTNYGVFGESESPDGSGVFGIGGRGVYGQTNSTNGYGIVGYAVSSTGTSVGVWGAVASSNGFSGYFKGGKFYVNGRVGLGTESPAATLHIHHTNATAGLMPDQGLRIQNASGTNRFWTLYTFSSNGALALYSGTGDGVSVGNFNAGTGAYTATSNRHLKTNISLLDSDILDKIALLKPARYSYLRDPMNQMTIGFMAEDVQPLFPELVDTVGENNENMAINYAGFSVVAIKAIQQQQKQMEALQTENEQLKKRLERIEKLVASTAEKGNE